MTEREWNEGRLLVDFAIHQKPIPPNHDHSHWVDEVVFFLSDHYGYKVGVERSTFIHEMFSALDRYLWEKLPKGRGEDPSIAGGSALTGREC